MDTYYSKEELEQFRFKSIGRNVRISRKSSIYGAPNIILGDNVRIDDFSVITAREEMFIGHFVHISCLSFLHGYKSIRIGNFAQVSSRVGLYTSSADFTGETFTNPLLPANQLRDVDMGPITLGDCAIVGTGATVMQNVDIGEGAVVGANSFVNRSLAPWTMSIGSPARFFRERKRDVVLEESKRALEALGH